MQKELTRRKNIRLRGYDYSQNGAYFVTICVKDRYELLGNIVGTIAPDRPCMAVPDRPYIKLTPTGECVDETINKANKGNATIDKYIIMPNHIHMIVILGESTDDRGRSSLQQIVRNIKSYVTKQVGYSLWQPRFHDHIIRNEAEYQKIWRYIDENPARWQDDCYNMSGIET